MACDIFEASGQTICLHVSQVRNKDAMQTRSPSPLLPHSSNVEYGPCCPKTKKNVHPTLSCGGKGGGRGQVNSYGTQGAQVRSPASIRRLLAAAAGPVEPSGEYSLSPLARTFCALKKYYHQPDPTCFRQARVQVILFPNQGGGRGTPTQESSENHDFGPSWGTLPQKK